MVSGRILVTPGTFIPRASLLARMLLSLRVLSCEITLATKIHFLVRYSKRTLQRH